ncbi:MAG: ATP-binding protein, partial [Pseudomonadota bacterium]|nr:ATP-binding protein [Pseudomonadota bacterium]
MSDDSEDELLRSVALRNASAILLARRRVEEDLLRANEALEERTRELAHTLSVMRATLESTADGILVTDSSGRVTTFNQKFLDIWGLPHDTVASGAHADLVRSVSHLFETPKAMAERIDAVYASADSALDTLALRDGRWFERFSLPQYVEGENVGRVWSYRDVTARRQAEDALRDEARVLDLLNQTGSAVASTLDLPTVLQTVTDAATQLSGARFGAFFYNTLDERGEAFLLYTLSGAPRSAFDRFGLPRATPMFGPTFNGDGPVRVDDVLLDPRYGRMAPHHGLPPGHLPVRSYLAVPVKLRSGDTIGGLFFGHPEPGVFDARAERLIVGIAAQASIAVDNARVYEEARRVAAEKERLVEIERAARAEADRVSRLKDEFLATLSHELRTPLTAILGWAKVLLLKRDDRASLTRGLDAIARNAKAQARLIEDLLDMNRIVSGKVRLEVQPTDIGAVVEAAIDSIRPSADAKSLGLHVAVDARAGVITGDPNRLQQVVWNLLTNAVKFTPRGGRIDVVAECVDGHVEVTVRDDGIGIDAHFLPQVFDRFRQADASTTRSHGGLGLGLSIAKQLTDLHGGTLRASSDGLDRGATFILRLPTHAAGAPAEAAPPSAPQRGAGAGPVEL